MNKQEKVIADTIESEFLQTLREIQKNQRQMELKFEDALAKFANSLEVNSIQGNYPAELTKALNVIGSYFGPKIQPERRKQ